MSNHEYTNEELMFPGFTSQDALTVEQVEVAMAAHGMSVVEIERVGRTGQWRPVSGPAPPYNRRITTLSTPFAFDRPGRRLGAAADRRRPDAAASAIGTLNNCAGGVTPWGTVLSGEENFNQYFVGGDGAPGGAQAERWPGTASPPPPATRRAAASGTGPRSASTWPSTRTRPTGSAGSSRSTRTTRTRPRASTPRWAGSSTRARTSSWRADGHVVAYMGDDERFDYLYKFVSDKKFDAATRAARRHNLTLLESGTLYVAKFTATARRPRSTAPASCPPTARSTAPASGSRWSRGDRSLRAGHDRRGGAGLHPARRRRGRRDQDGPPRGRRAQPVDRQDLRRADQQHQPGRRHATPGADEANPRNDNKHGHILEITEDGGDHTGETFTWSLPIVCGDPADPATYFAGYDKTKVSPISCPDNVAFDSAGNLWISTDGNALGSNDGLFATPIEGPERGHLKQFLTVPFGAETCGPFITGDDRSVFVAVQHPGEITGATVENPASTWPDGDFAKPAVVVTWRLDGGPIGS